MKRMLLILVALAACLALVAPAMACPNPPCEKTNLYSKDSASASAPVIGEGYNVNGTAFGGGGFEGSADAGSFIMGKVRGCEPGMDAYANAYAPESGIYATGGGFALNDLTVRKYIIFGPEVGAAAFGLSWGHSQMENSADAYTTYSGDYFFGLRGAIASVEGHAYQQNGLDIYADYGPVAGFFASGGSLTGATYSGIDLGWSGASVNGSALADGFTEGSGLTTGNYTTVQIATFGNSSATQSGYGSTNAYGSGGVNHNAAAFSQGSNGYAQAGTSGSANFSYSADGNGYGGASTTGTSSTSVNNGVVSAGAESHSHSFSGTSGAGGQGPQ